VSDFIWQMLNWKGGLGKSGYDIPASIRISGQNNALEPSPKSKSTSPPVSRPIESELGSEGRDGLRHEHDSSHPNQSTNVNASDGNIRGEVVKNADVDMSPVDSLADADVPFNQKNRGKFQGYTSIVVDRVNIEQSTALKTSGPTARAADEDSGQEMPSAGEVAKAAMKIDSNSSHIDHPAQQLVQDDLGVDSSMPIDNSIEAASESASRSIDVPVKQGTSENMRGFSIGDKDMSDQAPPKAASPAGQSNRHMSLARTDGR
jgi:hypothetical protein